MHLYRRQRSAAGLANAPFILWLLKWLLFGCIPVEALLQDSVSVRWSTCQEVSCVCQARWLSAIISY